MVPCCNKLALKILPKDPAADLFAFDTRDVRILAFAIFVISAMADIIIRPATTADLPQLYAFEQGVIAAERDGTLLGSGYARIDPAHRGQGINTLLIESLRQWALSRDITELRLDVYTTNPRAIRAYEKAGFTPLLLQMRRPTAD